jgi:hypothetical protein
VALVDDSPLQENNVINDWIAGNSRIFNRTYVFTDEEAADSIAAAFLTIKLNPNDLDANALLQVKITQILTVNGVVTPPGTMEFAIFASQYNAQVNAGTTYYYDITIITAAGYTYTAETGTIFFQQGVTQADAAGTPSAQPDQGIPIFRGYAAQPPTTGGPYNLGDTFNNNNPVVGGPSGWICTAAGTPGTWSVISNIV